MQLSLKHTTDAIAHAMLAGQPDVEGVLERVTAALGKQGNWLPLLVGEVLPLFGLRWEHVTYQDLAAFIALNEHFVQVWCSRERPVVIRLLKAAPRQKPPVHALGHLNLPRLDTSGDLATWLGITPGELDWFADHWRLPAGNLATPLQHYVYKRVEKRDGRCRLIEVPKSRLRALQRGILRGLLERVPPHEAAHGFRRGRSIVSYAAAHSGSPVVIRMDLSDFFISIPAGRVFRLLVTLGYPPEVVRRLTALCTNRVATADLRTESGRPGPGNHLSWQECQQYRTRHLPQGAPTSPMLANLCAYRLDVRLSALARSMGGSYTRYADDLAFSGGSRLAAAARRFCIQVGAIALEEGFDIQHRKTRVMGQRQRQHLAGVVVNSHPNMARDQFDRLKAILTNCVRHGPASQNRDACVDFRAHLEGRVAQAGMLNPARGAKLWRIFEQIVWNQP